MSRIQASDDPSDTSGREPRVGKKCRHPPQIFWPFAMLRPLAMLRHCTPLSDALLSAPARVSLAMDILRVLGRAVGGRDRSAKARQGKAFLLHPTRRTYIFALPCLALPCLALPCLASLCPLRTLDYASCDASFVTLHHSSQSSEVPNIHMCTSLSRLVRRDSTSSKAGGACKRQCRTSSRALNAAMEVSLSMAVAAWSSRGVGVVSASNATTTPNLRYQPIALGCFHDLLERSRQQRSFTLHGG